MIMTADALLQERVETILRRAKVRAAVLAEEVTVDEAWAIYDRAAEALGQRPARFLRHLRTGDSS
jgi:hypothetical protein